MTFRGSCAALAVVVLAGGQAQPHPGAGYPPPQAGAYYVATPPSGWALSVTEEAGKARLQVQTPDGLSASCEQITIPVNGMGSAVVSVAEKQVQVRCDSNVPAGGSSDALQGSADRVTRSGADGLLLSLEGKAQLRFMRQGRRAELSADRISVNLANGHVEVDLGGPAPAVTIPVPCSQTGSLPSCSPMLAPASPSSRSNQKDAEQVFSFWTGFFR
jgi:hypothetical protein